MQELAVRKSRMSIALIVIKNSKEENMQKTSNSCKVLHDGFRAILKK